MTALVFLSSGNPAFGQDPVNPTALKRMTLEELGRIEVTSVAKAPETLSHTAAAMFVLTSEDIARSGATSIPDALRLVPGVEVARIDMSRNWVVGIRGFGDQFSKSVLVLIDGRSAYTPLWAGVHRNLLAPQLYLDVALFRNRYDDLVDLGAPTARADSTDGVPYTALVLPWINGNEATTQGIEVSRTGSPMSACGCAAHTRT